MSDLLIILSVGIIYPLLYFTIMGFVTFDHFNILSLTIVLLVIAFTSLIKKYNIVLGTLIILLSIMLYLTY